MYLLILFFSSNLFYAACNLHPTMYLLIPSQPPSFVLPLKFTSHYVSINSKQATMFYSAYVSFTSHYVSINSVIIIR